MQFLRGSRIAQLIGNRHKIMELFDIQNDLPFSIYS